MPQAPPDLQAMFNDAMRHHQAGRLNEAERLYRLVVQRDPGNAFALHLLGILAHQAGRIDEAAQMIGKAIALNRRVAAFHNSLGNVLREQGELDEAVAAYRRALALQPDMAEASCNLGGVLAQQGKPEEAVAAFRKALAHKPGYAKAHIGLGDAFKEQGLLEEAVASFRRALAASPGDAVALNNLGNALKALGRLDEAASAYRQVLAAHPRLAEAHNNLGNVLAEQGRLDEAASAYRQAILHKPGMTDAHNSLGIVLSGLGQVEDAAASYQRALALRPDHAAAAANLALLSGAMGEHRAAMQVVLQSLGHSESDEVKRAFAACARGAADIGDDPALRAAMTRALSEAWGRPSDLAVSAAKLVMDTPDIRACVDAALASWPTRLPARALFAMPGFDHVAGDSLLAALLACVPVCDHYLERYLTLVRHALLETAGADGHQADAYLEFFSALARQCFINEYMFCLAPDELRAAEALRDRMADALEAGAQTPLCLVVAVACYFPLSSVAHAERLLNMQWPAPVRALLDQQVGEPLQEAAERVGIASLTGIDDSVSLLVQSQYEESPYPRWVRLAPPGNPVTVAHYLATKFPLSGLRPPAAEGPPRILVAGCGTGQHAIQTARQFRDAEVTAIDLSRNSLGYARRKTRELGLTSITYAQADLLNLDWDGPAFDVIEAVGVLHHLADPWAGWRRLLTLLQPGGFMNIGLYSELARQQVVAIRDLIAREGHAASADAIRQFRQVLIDRGGFEAITRSLDFCSLSMCRDLLFHVQEHRLGLDQIDAFLRENDLSFLGFDLGMGRLSAYRHRFAGDPACTDLKQWQTFETENPDTFSEMYNFWIQKPGPEQ